MSVTRTQEGINSVGVFSHQDTDKIQKMPIRMSSLNELMVDTVSQECNAQSDN